MVGTNHRHSRGGETGEETVEDRKTTNQPAVRESERPKDSLIAGDVNDQKCLGFPMCGRKLLLKCHDR